LWLLYQHGAYTVVGASPVVAGTSGNEATQTQCCHGGDEDNEEKRSKGNPNNLSSSETIS